MTEDGEPDFTAVDARKAWTAGERRRCGLCGKRMDRWVAFIGGPSAAKQGLFLDPPMHVRCAEAALVLCPHMATQRTQRARRHKAEDVSTPDGFVETKPEEWCLYITRQYDQKLIPTGYLFLAAYPRKVRRYRYDEHGALKEVDE